MTTKPHLLCVDDEPELLAAVKLNLRRWYRVTTADSGPSALALFDAHTGPAGISPFDVVVSDMRMPNMTGAELLTQLRHRYPKMPRLLLSGQSDLDSAIAAINDAKVFRFLTKPCSRDVLVEAIDEALEQARLRDVERVLLDKTLHGTVELLTEVLGLVSPSAYARTMRVDAIVRRLSNAINRPVNWELNLAAMLSQIGFVVVPESEADPETTNAADQRQAQVAANLLDKIPRLETVAELVRLQNSATAREQSQKQIEWKAEHLDAELLRVAVQVEHLMSSGSTHGEAADELANWASPPPLFLLDALKADSEADSELVEFSARVKELKPGMQIRDRVVTTSGTMLAGDGVHLSAALIGRILVFASSQGIREPIEVLAPRQLLPKTAKQ